MRQSLSGDETDNRLSGDERQPTYFPSLPSPKNTPRTKRNKQELKLGLDLSSSTTDLGYLEGRCGRLVLEWR